MLAIWDTLTDIRKARSKRKEASDRTTLCSCVGGLLLHTFLHAVSEGEYIFCALYRGAVCKKTAVILFHSILTPYYILLFATPLQFPEGGRMGEFLNRKTFWWWTSFSLIYPSIKYVMLSIQWNYIALIVYNGNLDLFIYKVTNSEMGPAPT